MKCATFAVFTFAAITSSTFAGNCGACSPVVLSGHSAARVSPYAVYAARAASATPVVSASCCDGRVAYSVADTAPTLAPSGQAVPQTVAPQTVIPETVAPQTVIPQTGVPQAVIPQAAVPSAGCSPCGGCPPPCGCRQRTTTYRVGPEITVGRGMLGQPKAYVPGQPIRNFLRFLTP